MSDESSQLNIRMDRKLKNDFIAKARENETTVTDLIVAYAKEYLGLEPKKPNDEIADLKQRLIKLEQIVTGELAA